MRGILRHFLHWLGWAAAITAAGAALGALLFPLWGLAFAREHSAGELALLGARSLGFVAGIWAPGAALILVLMRARRRQACCDQAAPPPAG